MQQRIDNKKASKITELTAELKEDQVLKLVEKRLENGVDPLEIIKDCQRGMQIVGQKYEAKEYYLSGMIMAGEILKEVMKIIEPYIQENNEDNNIEGKIVLGTVAEDIHDLGKNIFQILLNCHGFQVIDLGVDVSADSFIKAVNDHKPDIIGLSGVMLSSHDRMKEIIKTLENNFPETCPPIVIGGSQLNQDVADYIEIEYWSKDAVKGLELCQSLIKRKGKSSNENNNDCL
ncbi:MAG: cobalamin B12-binding domain-containing protein [Bacillota bacterium]